MSDKFVIYHSGKKIKPRAVPYTRTMPYTELVQSVNGFEYHRTANKHRAFLKNRQGYWWELKA